MNLWKEKQRIYHKDLGPGKVIKVDPQGYRASVEFDSGSTLNGFSIFRESKNFLSEEDGTRWKERIQKENELKDRLKEFTRLLSRAFAQTLVEKVRTTPLAPNADDRELVRRWLQGQEHPEKESEKLRLTSARLAEKAATQFFESYDKSVTDVAITQTTGGNNDWKRFDLDVEGTPVDVKNARRSERNEKRYVSQCVPEFKEKVRQTSQEVKIAGVVSYWQNLNEMENPKLGRKPALILGVTQLSEIDTIQKLFSTSPLKLELKRGLDGPTFLPPWIYNYPGYCYQTRDQALQEIRAFTLDQELLESLKSANLMPILTAADHPQIYELASDLDSRECEFLDRLLKRLRSTGISLPIIFLTVLEEFLEILREGGDEQFEKEHYIRLLFPGGNQKWPLYAHDPLETVHTLLETLETLWEARVGGLDQMTSFRLHNLNVLSGKSEQHDRWQTILAYCGGWISGIDGSSRRCGKTPLVMGESENCKCGKLICSNCGYCKKGCDLCEPRQQIWESTK